MTQFHPRLLTFALLLLLATAGCRGLRTWMQPQPGPQAPAVLPEEPNLSQVLSAVNQNSQRVQSYYSPNARISASGLPALRADIALQRPRNFRLRAQLAVGFTGPEIDLGSNRHEFWFWVRRSQPPAVYYAAHDQYQASAVRHLVPVDPDWLIDALGMPQFDAAAQHTGPRRLRDGRLEVRSVVHSPTGELVKITLVDPVRAWVLEQHMYSADGKRIASAMADQFRYDPAHAVSLPGHIEVQLPTANLNLQIDAGDFRINQPPGDPAQMFSRPSYDGYPEVNLAAAFPRIPKREPSATVRREAPARQRGTQHLRSLVYRLPKP